MTTNSQSKLGKIRFLSLMEAMCVRVLLFNLMKCRKIGLYCCYFDTGISLEYVFLLDMRNMLKLSLNSMDLCM